MVAYTKMSKFIVYRVFIFFTELRNHGVIHKSLESSLAASLLCINRNRRTVNIPSRWLTTIISYMPHMAELLNQRPSGWRSLNPGPGSVSYKSNNCLIQYLNNTSALRSVKKPTRFVNDLISWHVCVDLGSGPSSDCVSLRAQNQLVCFLPSCGLQIKRVQKSFRKVHYDTLFI